MEFTKYEKRLLDPSFPRRNRMFLILPILFLSAALLVLVIGSRYTQKVRKPYQDMLVDTHKIVIQSQKEEILKQSLIRTIEAAELGWYKYAESVWLKMFEFLLLFGGIFLLTYWRNLRIHRLLKKLDLPPDPVRDGN